MTRESMFKIGDRVNVVLKDDADLYRTQWWPKKGTPVTGTVQKVFKNGKVAVAIDQLKNRSEDGKHTMHMSAESLRLI